MEEEIITKKPSISWLKTILVLAVFLFFTLPIYYLIFSPLIANYQSIIDIRHKYVSIVYSIRQSLNLGDSDNCWYFRQPIRTLRTTPEKEYVYGINGKLVGVDEEANTITLECSSGKRYKANLNIVKHTVPGWVIIEQGRNSNIDKPRDYQFLFYEADLKRSGELDKYYKDDQSYSFIWQDKRRLTDIYSVIKKNPNEPVNSSDTVVVGFIR